MELLCSYGGRRDRGRDRERDRGRDRERDRERDRVWVNNTLSIVSGIPLIMHTRCPDFRGLYKYTCVGKRCQRHSRSNYALNSPNEIADDSYSVSLQPYYVRGGVGVSGKPRATESEYCAAGDPASCWTSPVDHCKSQGHWLAL